jgi:flagellin-like hook-associated protein FlgL
MEANILKGVSNLTSKFAKSAVKLIAGHNVVVLRDELETANVNMVSSHSRITDVDAAREMIEITKATILSRAKKSVSGQANMAQRDVINLIQ